MKAFFTSVTAAIGADLHTIRLTVERPGRQQPVVMGFKYDYRRR